MDKYLLLLFTLMSLSGCHCDPDPRYEYLEWHKKDVEFLIEKLENGDISERDIASGAVGRIGEPAQAAVPALIRVLEDEISWTRRNAAEALDPIGSSPSNRKPGGLSEAFRREMVRCGVTWALGQIGPPAIDAVPVLLLALKDPDETVRSNAAKSLGQIGKQDIALLPDLVRAMNDESWGVRVSAAYAVYRTDRSQWDIVLPLLTEALNHKKGFIRSDVVDVLGDIKAPIQDAMPLLVKALNDEDASVRRGTLEALGKIGDPIAVPVLREALQDRSVVQEAAIALTQIDVPEALQTLISALSDTDSAVRYYVSDALAEMNPPPKEVAAALIGVLNDTNLGVRRLAANALGKIGDPAAVPMLIENLTHPNPWVGKAAIDALKEIGTPEALKAVQEFDSKSRPSGAACL